MKKAQAPRALIVGAGAESLAAACALAGGGLRVVVVEKRAAPGGTRGRWTAAPEVPAALVFDQPTFVDPGVARGLSLEQHGLVLGSVPVSLAALEPDGRVLELTTGRDRARTARSAVSDRDAQALERFSATMDRLARALAPVFKRAPPRDTPDFADLWTAVQTGRRFLGLAKKEAFAILRWPPMPVADLVSEWLESDALRALVATRGLFGVFGGPRSAGTSAVLLLRSFAEGGLVPRAPAVNGGGPALVDALAGRARALGVELRLEREVRQIVVDKGRAAAVVLDDGSQLDAHVVVSGIGPQRTLLDLLEPSVLSPELTRRVLNIRARGTVARVLLVIDGLPSVKAAEGSMQALPLVFHVAPGLDGLERAFDAMKYGRWSDDLWLEVTVHASTDADATRRAALGITAHMVPRGLRDTTWPDSRSRLADAVVAVLERRLPGLTSRIVDRHVLTPDDLSRDLGLAGGHPLHAELSLDQLWMARPALGLGGYRAPVKGLFLCGPGTHPGVGPTLTSGWLASREVLDDLRKR